MRLNADTPGLITAGRAVVAEVSDAQRIAAAADAGIRPEVAGLVFQGKLTLNRAIQAGMRLGLISRPETGPARAANLIT